MESRLADTRSRRLLPHGANQFPGGSFTRWSPVPFMAHFSPTTLFSENSEQSVTEENGFRHVAGVQYQHGINSLGNNPMKVSRVTTGVIFLCAAGSIAWLFISIAPGDRPTPSAAIASALAFVVASEGVFLRPRFSYWLGLVSGIVALYWFSRIEFRYFPALNSWIAFNLPDGNPQFFSDVFLAKLKILLVVTVVTSTACCMTRLLPASWVLRKVPVRERTWPALGVCLVVVASWYGLSASPYRIPLIVDGVSPELTVLHMQKRGIQFNETAISASRDGRLYVHRNNRTLFQYRFAVHEGVGMLPETITARIRMLTQSNELRDLRTAPAVALRSKNAEGWYIRTERGVSAFTTEYGTEPPSEVVDLFHEMESVVPTGKELRTANDVCMGFCYDPLAGLGLNNLNDRCAERNGTRCK
jgi:hypothetical protein